MRDVADNIENRPSHGLKIDMDVSLPNSPGSGAAIGCHVGEDMHDCTDSQLIEMYLKDQSSAAMAQIVQRYGGLVMGIASSVLDRKEDREDVFQATFGILCISAKKIRKTASLGSYLYGVAHRTSKRMRQRSLLERGRVQSMDNADLDRLNLRDLEDQNDVVACRASDLAKLEQAILQLPESVRIPIIEHHILGNSVPTVAQKLRLTVYAVESRIKRGKQKLKSILKKRGVGSPSAMVESLIILNQRQAAEPSRKCVEETLTHCLTLGPGRFDDSQIDHSTNQGYLIHEEIVMSTTRKKWLLTASALGVGGLLLTGGAIQLPALLAQATPVQNGEKTESQEDPFDDSSGVPETQAKSDAKKSNERVDDKSEDSDDFDSDWLLDNSLEDQASEKLRQKLRTSRQAVAFNATPLDQVLQTIAEEQGIDIVIDLRAFQEDQIAPDEPVTLVLKNAVSTRTWLVFLLEPLKLTYAVRDGVLFVTTQNNTALTIRTYDLKEIFNSDNFLEPELKLELIGLIESVVDPNVWQSGIGVATCNMFGSLLVVNATETTHLRVEKFLQTLSKHDLSKIKASKPHP